MGKYSSNTLVKYAHTKNVFHTSMMSPFQWNTVLKYSKLHFLDFWQPSSPRLFPHHVCFDFDQTHESYFAYSAKIAKILANQITTTFSASQGHSKALTKSSESFGDPGDEVAAILGFILLNQHFQYLVI